MHIEICDNTRTTLIVLIACATLAAVGIGGCSIDAETSRTYAKAGLVQKQATGAQGCFWTKP